MALTIGFTSMDQATETALRAAFDDANRQLDGRFSLVDDSSAQFVIIDMDSMYGPMGWLRLHAAGRSVVGLTAAERTQADFRLGRPFDTASMVAMLREIADAAGATGPEPTPSPDTRESTPAADMPPPAAQATPRPTPNLAPLLKAPSARPKEESATGSPATVPMATGEHDVPGAQAQPAQALEPEETPESEAAPAPPPPREQRLADWLRPGALSGRVRLACEGAPTLWINADARTYHGATLLKPLAPHFEPALAREAFQPVDSDAWADGAQGEAQPLTRLQWLGGLLAGQGQLMDGLDPDGRYQLTKWPQTEREYPRHFRIATVMMKGPATLEEIARDCGATVADVADFVNANLATGYAVHVPEPEPEPEPVPRNTGFLGRLRRRS